MMIEVPRDLGDASQRIERVAEVEPVPDMRVEKGTRPDQIAPAQEASRFHVVQRKGVISDQLRNSFLTPQMPCAKNQLLVGDVLADLIAMLLELAPQIVATVESHFTEKPDAPVERARLRGTLRRGSGSQKCEAESGARFGCDVSAVWPAKRQRLRHPFEQTRIGRRSIE